jgi:hypothetical protein
MSYASATGAQRLEVNSAATLLSTVSAPARHGLNGPGVAGHDDAEAAAARTAAALSAIGVTAELPATQTIVSDTQALTGVTPSGSYVDTVTFTVAGGVITAIVLS